MTFNRRAFLNACTRAGIASPLLPGFCYTLAAQAQEASPGANAGASPAGASNAGGEAGKEPVLPKVTAEMIDRAAELAGVGPFTVAQKKMMLDGLNDQRDAYAQIRALKIANDVPPAYVFHPAPAAKPASEQRCVRGHDRRNWFLTTAETGEPKTPANIEDLAFASVLELANLIFHRKITSVALTQMYIDRLKRYDPKLHFVITLTGGPGDGSGEERPTRKLPRRALSRAAARDSVGREGFAGGEGLSDDVGRGRVRAPDIQ